MRPDTFLAIFPIYHLSRASGVLPVKLVINKKGRYEGQLEILKIRFGVGLFLLLLGLQCLGLYRELRDGWRNSSRYETIPKIVSNGIDLFANIIPFAVAIIGAPFRLTHLERVFRKITQVDEELENIKPPKYLHKLPIYLISVSLVPSIILWLADFIVEFCWFDVQRWGGYGIKGSINFIPFYFMQFIALVMELQIAIAVLNIGERFNYINKAIKHLIRANEFDKYFRKDFAWYISNSANAIYNIATLHLSMIDCVSSTNEAYGLVILVISMRCLLQFTSTLYALNTVDMRWPILADIVAWLIFHSYGLLLFAESCHSMSAKANATGPLVSRALIHDWDSDTLQELEAFSNILLQNRVQITACGLFPVDRSLVAAIVGTATTYLVILLQYRDNS